MSEREICRPNPCQFGTKCVETGDDSYSCVKSMCHPNPCQNSGKCINVNENKFQCACTVDYEGRTCEGRKRIVIYCLAVRYYRIKTCLVTIIKSITVTHYGSRAFVVVYILIYFVKTENNVKNIFFASTQVKNRQNNRNFVQHCFFIRWFVKIFYRVAQTKWPPASN